MHEFRGLCCRAVPDAPANFRYGQSKSVPRIGLAQRVSREILLVAEIADKPT
jgi:hypothetical protein